MIFSLSNKVAPIELPSLANVDIFCFFSCDNAVSCPEQMWIEYICASLRMKKNVLILSSRVTIFPEYDSSKRWQIGGQFIWLASHAWGPINEMDYPKNMDFDQFAQFLSMYKPLKSGKI